MSAPAIQTHDEFVGKVRPLRVENGRVADGEFAGATATRDMRWTCLGLRCVELDGWRVHEPQCDWDDRMPPEPLPLPGPYEARQIEYQELLRSGHFDLFDGCRDGELARRPENTRRGGDGR